MEPVDPLVAIGTTVVIVVASRLLRGVPVAGRILAAAAGIAIAVASRALMDWATADQARLSLLLDVMVGVALFAVYEIIRKRLRRAAP